MVNQCLWRADTHIPIPPKVFAVLEYLVRNAGRLVPQEELLEMVWPETYVQPEVLRKYILEIRKILDDPARQPQFVETVSRRGYRFIAPVRDEGKHAQEEEAVGLSSRLVGREATVGELKSHFETAVHGHRRVVFLTGEAGIGKTSIADALSDWTSASAWVARGQCVEGFGGKEAYYPLLEALGGLLRSADGAMVAETLADQAPTWLIQFPSFIEPRRKEELHQELLGATRERMRSFSCARSMPPPAGSSRTAW